MSLLFDISPDEVPDRQKRSKRSRAAAPDEPPAAAPTVTFVQYVVLGQSDGHYKCHKPSCGAEYFDIIDDYRGEWLIECAFCGWQQRVPSIEGVIALSDEFVFFDGRFSGMTLAQASCQDKGEPYILWCSQKHKSEVVREACQKWLSSVGYRAPHRSESCSS